MRPRLWLIFIPFAIHWPALSGWLSADPIYLESGLAPSWQSNGVLPGLPGWIDGNAGITLEALGHLAATDWKAGIVPWWNPYSGIGLPLAGEMQPAAFFLPFVLLLGLSNGVLYLKIVLMMIGGLSMWGLLRELRLAPSACLTGAVLFQLNGTFAWDSDSSSLPIAFLPLFLLGIERAIAAARAGEPGGWRLLCVAIAYSILAGFPETAFADGLLALAWAALRFLQASGVRIAFLYRIALGGTVALMLCSPLLWAFASFIGQSDLALRDFGNSSLQWADFALFLFPYAYGPIFFGGQVDIWYRIGGYVGLPVLLLALAAVFATPGREPVHERALRWLLGSWIVCCLAKAAGVMGVTELWNLIPGIAESMFFRYAAPSWECAASVLAALAMHDIVTLDPVRRRRQMMRAAPSCLALCAGVLVAGRPVWRVLGSVDGGRIWFFLAVGWGLWCLCVIALAWLGRGPWAKAAFAMLLADASIQFSIPLLAGTRDGARNMDIGVVSFLQTNLGLNRFFSIGPLPPNYGAFYRLAQINHDYAPVAANWTRYVNEKLDPHADPVMFNGFSPAAEPGVETRTEALRRRFPAYAALGVKYVLARNWANPFAITPTSIRSPTSAAPLVLQPGQQATGVVQPGEYDPGPVGAALLTLATYGATATGDIVMSLCAGKDCAEATVPLAGVADNSTILLKLDHVVTIAAGKGFTFHVTHRGGTTNVAPWLFATGVPPRAALEGPRPVPKNDMLALSLLPPDDGTYPEAVFHGRLVDIYKLPDAAPYFEAAGCTQSNATRLRVDLHCAKPSVLIRRELFFPGWHARVNDAATQIGQGGLFQKIALSAGDSQVRFNFAPPYVGGTYILGGVAMMILATRRKVFFFEKKKQKTFAS